CRAAGFGLRPLMTQVLLKRRQKQQKTRATAAMVYGVNSQRFLPPTRWQMPRLPSGRTARRRSPDCLPVISGSADGLQQPEHLAVVEPEPSAAGDLEGRQVALADPAPDGRGR